MMCAIARTSVLGVLVFALGLLVPAGAVPRVPVSPAAPTGSLSELYDLNYADGSITVFRVVKGVPQIFSRFRPSPTGAQGLAVDRLGRIYTTVTGLKSGPCSSACIDIFAPRGVLIARIPAPILPGAPGAPNLTDVSLDALGNVYVSDYGQQAVYFYAPAQRGWTGPTIVVHNSQNAASVLARPDSNTVFVSGGCGFASARPFVRTHSGYQPGACFGIGTIALIGGATDNTGAILTPVDGAGQLVSVSSPNGGGTTFAIPDRRGAVGGITLADGGGTAFVADGHAQKIYAFARPLNGWLSGTPKLAATYAGFQGLNVIAIKP